MSYWTKQRRERELVTGYCPEVDVTIRPKLLKSDKSLDCWPCPSIPNSKPTSWVCPIYYDVTVYGLSEHLLCFLMDFQHSAESPLLRYRHFKPRWPESEHQYGEWQDVSAHSRPVKNRLGEIELLHELA